MSDNTIENNNEENNQIKGKHNECINKNKYDKLKHSWHIVDNSPWPFVVSAFTFSAVIGLVSYIHIYFGGGSLIIISFIFLLFTVSSWILDIIHESTYEGQHTLEVQKNLKNGFILFIASEFILFFSLFWAFFHSALAPTLWIGAVWPPMGIKTVSPWGVPFLNTVLLLTSGCSAVVAHNYIRLGNLRLSFKYIIVTLLFSLLFLSCQFIEYLECAFSINDSIYGSTFFMITGFHGIHVIIGSIFLLVQVYRQTLNHFTSTRHFGLEFAFWYWHFVDFVWIFVWIALYWWGSAP